MRSRLYRLIAALLCVLLIAGMLPFAAFAKANLGDPAFREIPEAEAAATVMNGSHLTVIRPDAGKERRNNGADKQNEDPLPAYYDSRELGIITGVKSQQYSDCWAHGAMSSIETYMMKYGVGVTRAGAYAGAADLSLDLSENTHVSFSYNGIPDKLGVANDEIIYPVDISPYDQGGNDIISSITLMSGVGPVDEAAAPELGYRRDLTIDSVYGDEYAFDFNAAQVTDVQMILTRERENVKRAIIEYGSGTLSYCSAPYHESWIYTNPYTGASCFIQDAGYGSDDYWYPDHEVTIVGWDDNYSRENFNEASRPEHDGAWIIKNSWGTDYFDGGYIYLSYEDTASYDDYCTFFRVEELDPERSVYQFDNLAGFLYFTRSSGARAANVFTAQKDELLTDVAFFVEQVGAEYDVQVFTDCSADDPTDGTLVAEKSGSFVDFGYRSVVLDRPVALAEGQRFSVVVTLSDPAGGNVYFYVAGDTSFWSFVADHGYYENSAYLLNDDGSGWFNVSDNYNFRIRAYTEPLDEACADSPSGLHEYSGHTVVGEPTCTEGADSFRECVYCGTERHMTTVPLGHDWSEWEIDLEATRHSEGARHRVCARCSEVDEEIIPAVPVEWGFRNYELLINGADDVDFIRIGRGDYATSAELRASEGMISIDRATREALTDENGVFRYELPTLGTYTLWFRFDDGWTYLVSGAELSDLFPEIRRSGLSIIISGLYTDPEDPRGVSDVYIANGNFDDVAEFEGTESELAHITAADIAAQNNHRGHDYRYVFDYRVVFRGMPVTVAYKYNDGRVLNKRYILGFADPTASVNGLQVTVDWLDNVKCIRVASGTFDDIEDVRKAADVRVFSVKNVLAGKEEYTIQFRQAGDYTLSVEYADGFLKLINVTVAPLEPAVTVNADGTVTLEDLDDLYIIRFAPNPDNSADWVQGTFKRTAGNRYAKAADLAQGGSYTTPSLPGLLYKDPADGQYKTSDFWAIMVQYLDESYAIYKVDFTSGSLTRIR